MKTSLTQKKSLERSFRSYILQTDTQVYRVQAENKSAALLLGLKNMWYTEEEIKRIDVIRGEDNER